MTTVTTERARPEAIKAVPVRHPGRWVAVAVIAVLVTMFAHLILTNEPFECSFVFSRRCMFAPPVLEGLRDTILLTIFSMLIGVGAGIQSVDVGQSEAAEALGLTRGQTLRRIVLPQAMRVIVPPTGNETIAMVKDTSLVAFTPVTTELFFQLQAISARTFHVFPTLV